MRPFGTLPATRDRRAASTGLAAAFIGDRRWALRERSVSADLSVLGLNDEQVFGAGGLGQDATVGETTRAAPVGEGTGLRFGPAVARQPPSAGLCVALDGEEVSPADEHAVRLGEAGIEI